MGDWSLEHQYQALVRHGLETGDLACRRDGPDLRKAPRFRVRDGRITVRVEPEFSLVDVSAAGMAFLSEMTFRPDTRLAVIVMGAIAFQVRVVACPMVEMDSGLMEVRYRVQCRFDSESDGKHLLLMLKEFERAGPLEPRGA